MPDNVAVQERSTSMLRWLWLAFVVIVLDQITKVMAETQLTPYMPVAVFPGLNWTLSYNEGAAFSFLADAGGWQRWFFITLALGVSLFIAHWMRKLKSGDVMLAVALALIMGGALGNVWDRIYLGHVVDFIDVYYDRWHWPAFNIADSAICVGAVMMVLDSLRRKPESN